MKAEYLRKRSPMDDVWDEKFSPLADYNAEIYRGIVHTKEYDKQMEILQNEYNERLKEAYKAHSVILPAKLS